MPSLSEVKPWGRSFAEYRAMFALADADLNRSILDAAGGPSAFNAEATSLGASVISCDPLYIHSVSSIETRIDEIAPAMAKHIADGKDQYVWKNFNSPKQVVETRLTAMRRFLEDYPAGLAEGRYLPHSLPVLPFPARKFDLALCSHFLFTYSDILPLDFHLQSLRELARVADEGRIFPLLHADGPVSAHLQPLLATLRSEGFIMWLQPVSYEFQRGGARMLVLSHDA